MVSLQHHHIPSHTFLDGIDWDNLSVNEDGDFIIATGVPEVDFENALRTTICATCSSLLKTCYHTPQHEVVLFLSESSSHGVGAPVFEQSIQNALRDLGVPELFLPGTYLVKGKGKWNGALTPTEQINEDVEGTVVIEFADSQPRHSQGTKIGVIEKSLDWVSESPDSNQRPRLAIAINAVAKQHLLECYVYRRQQNRPPRQYGETVVVSITDHPGTKLVKLPVQELYHGVTVPTCLSNVHDVEVDLLPTLLAYHARKHSPRTKI